LSGADEALVPSIEEKGRSGTAGRQAALHLTARTQRWPKFGALASNRRAQSFAAALVYLGFAIYLTWPLVTDLDSTIYGAVGDLTGGISTFREYVEGAFPFAPGTIPDFNAPDGLAVRWTLNISTLSFTAPLYALSVAFGAVAAFGLFTLLGFMLSGLATFLLVRRLLGNPGVAFVAGYAYAFYPFVVVKAQGHVAFVHGWVLVLVLWRLVEVMGRPTRRNGLLAGGALVVAFAWTPYHILFAGVMALGFTPVALLFARRRGVLRPTAAALAVAGVIGLAWLGGMVALNRAAPTSEVRTHTTQEAITYSARWEEYVVPTNEHPIFGTSAGNYRASHLHGSNFSENTLYVGVSILVLALLGLVTAVRHPGPSRWVALAALAVSVVGFAFSAPPRVDLLGGNLPTPTQFVFELTTTWRAFSRLVEVVMLGLVLLAAMAMASIVRRRAVVIQGVLLAIMFVAIAGDLWTARPAQGTNKIGVPLTYQRLAQLPKGIAVEYPLLPADQSQYGDVFYQGWHNKPIVNGYYEGSPEESRDLALSDLSKPPTARGLQALGVRYVLVRQDLKAARLPDPGRPGRGFRFVTKDPYIALYELTLPGPQVLVTPMEGFAPPEQGPRGPFQWLIEPEGTVELRGSCSACNGFVRMTVGSFAQQREVTVRAPDGKLLARVRVSESRELRFPVHFNRKLALRIEAAPGPQSIAKTIGSADPRSVSISVQNVSFELRGKPGG
jgi:hypothetical protein